MEGMGESVEKLSALFGGGDDTPVGTVEQPEVEETELELDAVEAPDEETLDAEPEAELDDPEGDPGEEPEEGNEALHKVRAAGEEMEVTYDELVSGFTRHVDYTRKAMALGEERREFEGEREAVTQERAQYATGLGQLAQLIEAATRGTAPDPALLDTDPVAYQRAKLAYDGNLEKLATVQAEQTRVMQEQQAESQRRQAAYQQEQHTLMMSAIPEWQDDAVRKREVTELVDYAQSLGVTQEQMGSLTNHVDFVVLRKAMLFDRLKAKGRETAKKKVRTAKPGAGDAKGEVQSRKQRQTKKRFQQDGNMADGVSLIRDIMR